jgi:hypothetical protein
MVSTVEWKTEGPEGWYEIGATVLSPLTGRPDYPGGSVKFTVREHVYPWIAVRQKLLLRVDWMPGTEVATFP